MLDIIKIVDGLRKITKYSTRLMSKKTKEQNIKSECKVSNN